MDVELNEIRLGVALSGGGFRATVYGLGALLYLVDSGLNKQVTSISSVSGGSIAVNSRISCQSMRIKCH
jgi:NTE family protein